MAEPDLALRPCLLFWIALELEESDLLGLLTRPWTLRAWDVRGGVEDVLTSSSDDSSGLFRIDARGMAVKCTGLED